MSDNGSKGRVAFVLALAVGTVLVILAITVLWGVVTNHASLSNDATRFLTIVVGAVIGALAAYIGVSRKGVNGGNGA